MGRTCPVNLTLFHTMRSILWSECCDHIYSLQHLIIPDELHKKLKLSAVQKETTIKEYIIKIIEKEIEKTK